MKLTVGNRVISILGFQDTKILDVNGFLECLKDRIHPIAVQIFDADRVAGPCHLFFAYINAKKAHEQERRISDNLEMEILLYASGQRQIVKAIDIIGVHPHTSSLAVLLSGSSEKELLEAEELLTTSIYGIRNDEVLAVEGREKLKKLQQIYKITQLEMDTMLENGDTISEVLTWLIVERVALLTLNR
jgi:KEOPS complex subunit Cgi121